MTLKSITDQINTIREVTAEATISPEAALAFLQKAGIVGVPKKANGATHAVVQTSSSSHAVKVTTHKTSNWVGANTNPRYGRKAVNNGGVAYKGVKKAK